MVKLRSHHAAAYQHHPTNVHTKYEVSAPYRCPTFSPDVILKVKVTIARSYQCHTMTLHTYTPNQSSYQISTFYTLGFYKIETKQYFKDQGPYGKAKTKSHLEIAHLHPQPMFRLSINFLHLFSEIKPKQDFHIQGHYGKVKSRSHHDVAHPHPLRNVPTGINFLKLLVSEIQPGQD